MIENLIIEEGQIASWDGKTLIITLGDLGRCKANAGHCILDDRVAIWDGTAIENFFLFELKNIYKVKISGNNMILPFYCNDHLWQEMAIFFRNFLGSSCEVLFSPVGAPDNGISRQMQQTDERYTVPVELFVKLYLLFSCRCICHFQDMLRDSNG
uniref:Uncharacterized protein n=1 Tax=Romanomermis culicivorax TaxID=13658 RepID=A0A915HIS2_ROMCU